MMLKKDEVDDNTATMDENFSYKSDISNLLTFRNDGNNFLRLKNDFYENYGNFLYREALNEYDLLYDKDVYESYDEKLYKECEEIVMKMKSRNRRCFSVFYKREKKTQDEIDQMYKELQQTKIESIKVRLWSNCVNSIKYYNNLL